MRRALPLAAGLACLALAGPQALGRLLLIAGLPGLAAPLLSDPAERGVALYRAGRYAQADAALAASGRGQTYNRGLSLAAVGDYPLSVAYFDAVLYANPADAEARQSRDLVAAMYPPARGESIAPGRIQGHGGQGPGQQSPQSSPGAVQDPENQRRLDAGGIVASDAWLDSIPDDPGAFLKLRLAAEYDRRAAQGLVRPREGEPW
ncbi:Ca-activated chloride channel family protein [Paracoccus thiocyanatus]|uniref:Ca-activated chloride channel family protein n=1 Tax=Paracoccus thiocyanatus TaxID=34006 RepID=A0A1N6WJ18_9RHOB|nr:hypothetical protein [Paracoccus thiocyanatus]SIQ90089.1 Ca-activated chloride channel family protein [Paracoccus thiocyanatus]